MESTGTTALYSSKESMTMTDQSPTIAAKANLSKLEVNNLDQMLLSPQLRNDR